MCLASVSKQLTDANSSVEIIVSDDCSSKKNRVLNKNISIAYNSKYLFSEKNIGSGATRNIGVKESCGDWIAFLDDDVKVDDFWLENIIKKVNNCNMKTCGIEGRVVASGAGLWDSEIENLNGNLFLTANIIYRKKELLECGLFDARLLNYGEDQELALRMEMLGEIFFDSTVSVTHAPRKINFLSYLLNSFIRMQNFLNSENIFYRKHPKKYGSLRYADTFYGTLFSTCLKHTYLGLKRRKLMRLLTKPVSTFMLIIILITEQVAALFFAPKYFIDNAININKET